MNRVFLDLGFIKIYYYTIFIFFAIISACLLIFKEAKKAAEEEAKNTVFDAEDKAKKEAQSIAKDGEANVASLKEKAMANVDDAASIIVKNVL